MWETKQVLLKRWKRPRHNRTLRRRIAKLDKDIEEHAFQVRLAQWEETCNGLETQMRGASTWRLFRHLLDPEETKTAHGHKIRRLVRDFGGTPDEFLEALRKSGRKDPISAEKRHFFRAPRDSSRLQVWQRAIPRLDKQLPSSCVVCDLHFEDSDLVKEFVHNIIGDVVIIPRDNWALKDDAVPRLFPNCPSYLSKPARKRKHPAVRRAPPVKVRKRQGDGDVTSPRDDGS
ncbi:hypothetical protein HPB52_022250 [Rhipicephalus sanguineus]|uniref:THAP-type domain-containing protein n=1 Tax=Rhipicephalus sanguineus TaxID=34632 RepID=A0A9D4YQV4_RHISA|nr:hypothetical protein HPB52_022250 [Rhipicephalus sanguineus]